MSFHVNAVACNGTDEQLGNTTVQDIGIAGSWTINMWVQINVYGNYQNLLYITPTAGSNNAIYIPMYPTNRWIADIYGSTGTEVFRLSSADITSNIGSRTMFTVSYNGTTINLYKNGSIDNGTQTGTATAQTQTNRLIKVDGSSTANANFSKVDMWNTILTAAEITALYNSGTGYDKDTRSNFGNYISSSSLKHQWCFGKESTDIGHDYVSTGQIDLMANSVNISSADIVPFGSGSQSSGDVKTNILRKGRLGSI